MNYRKLFLLGAWVGLIAIAGYFHYEIYAYSWRLFHKQNIVAGQKQFRVPHGPYIWRWAQDPSILSIYEYSSNQSDITMTLYVEKNSAKLVDVIERSIITNGRCEISHTTLDIQAHSVLAATITCPDDSSFDKALLYWPVNSKVVMQVIGDKDTIRRNQSAIDDLLEQAVLN